MPFTADDNTDITNIFEYDIWSTYNNASLMSTAIPTTAIDEASRNKREPKKRGRSGEIEAAATRHGAIHAARSLHDRRPAAGYRRFDRCTGAL